MSRPSGYRLGSYTSDFQRWQRRPWNRDTWNIACLSQNLHINQRCWIQARPAVDSRRFRFGLIASGGEEVAIVADREVVWSAT
jgi:hypothetical protein